MRAIGTALLIALLVTGPGIHAQAPATFDVASVKANTSGATQVTVNWQGGVTLLNVPLRAIVEAFRAPRRVTGRAGGS